MKITLDKKNFMEQVRQHSRWKQFSYEAWEQIFEWEDEMGAEYDPVSFCCNYAEYASFKDLQSDYNDIKSFDDLEGKTWVANLPEGRVLIRQF
jgi:hypothetical protein|tara:strand:- start:19 stop:297 length:279 start_codon:yes stop_codon:yes gene_type:complete